MRLLTVLLLSLFTVTSFAKDNCVCISLQGNGDLLSSQWAGIAGFLQNHPDAKSQNLVPCGVVGGSSASISSMLLTAIMNNPAVKNAKGEKKRKLVVAMLKTIRPTFRAMRKRYLLAMAFNDQDDIDTFELIKNRKKIWGIPRGALTAERKIETEQITNMASATADILASGDAEFMKTVRECISANDDKDHFHLREDGKIGGIMNGIGNTLKGKSPDNCSRDHFREMARRIDTERKRNGGKKFCENSVDGYENMTVAIATGIVTGKHAQAIKPGFQGFDEPCKALKFGFIGLSNHIQSKSQLKGALKNMGCPKHYLDQVEAMPATSFCDAVTRSISEPNIHPAIPKCKTSKRGEACKSIAGFTSPAGAAIMKAAAPKRCSKVLTISRPGDGSSFIYDVVDNLGKNNSEGNKKSKECAAKQLDVSEDIPNTGKNCNLLVSTYNACVNDGRAEGESRAEMSERVYKKAGEAITRSQANASGLDIQYYGRVISGSGGGTKSQKGVKN